MIQDTCEISGRMNVAYRTCDECDLVSDENVQSEVAFEDDAKSVHDDAKVLS